VQHKVSTPQCHGSLKIVEADGGRLLEEHGGVDELEAGADGVRVPRSVQKLLGRF
jgi:hypothetical protein